MAYLEIISESMGRTSLKPDSILPLGTWWALAAFRETSSS